MVPPAVGRRFMAGDFVNPSALAEGAELMNWIDEVRSFKKSLLWCLEVGRFPGWKIGRAHV